MVNGNGLGGITAAAGFLSECFMIVRICEPACKPIGYDVMAGAGIEPAAQGCLD